jgi:inner membrane protein
MDSVTQFVLGAAIGVAVMGRRTAPWKAALWGGACGTLPDLDTFVDHGDPISNVTLHRGDSHSLLWGTLASPAIAWAISRLNGPVGSFRRWWLAVWLALFTHPLLDLMTVYGTQLMRPFTDHPYAVGSIFIIDPLYTLPLLGGVALALTCPAARGLWWNRAGLVLSTVYLAWSFGVQQHVESVANASLARQGIVADRVLVTATPFNTVLWRVVAMTPTGYHEGFYSLLDHAPTVRFEHFDRGAPLYEALAGNWHVDRVAWFTQGFFAMSQHREQVMITDLRMGQYPTYAFSFLVGERVADVTRPASLPGWSIVSHETDGGFRWLARRAAGQMIQSPR